MTAPPVALEGRARGCVDRVRVELAVADGRVAALAFEGEACAVGGLAAERLAGRVVGERLEFVEWLEAGDVLALLDAPPPDGSRACALLPLELLQRAVHAERARWFEPWGDA